MAKFKVGDRVRCVSKRMAGPRKGDEGKIVRLPDADALGRYEVQFDNLFYGYMMKEDELVAANSAACNASSSRNPVVANAVAWACGKVACNASPDGDERSMALVKENLVKLSHFIDDAYETARESQKTREMIEYVVSRMSPDGKAAAAKEIRNTLSAFQREISFMTGPWYRVKA